MRPEKLTFRTDTFSVRGVAACSRARGVPADLSIIWRRWGSLGMGALFTGSLGMGLGFMALKARAT